jgi:FKBP-type peptidyl-prolyl cis-trans isomerase 2
MGYIRPLEKIEMKYPGKLVDDRKLAHSTDREELEVAIGQKRVQLNFNKGAAPLGIGDRRTITVPPEHAFGRRREDLVFELEKEKLPETASPEMGQAVRIRQADGNAFDASIAEIRDDSVVLDANHPLAGKTLVFDIELVAVSYAS